MKKIKCKVINKHRKPFIFLSALILISLFTAISVFSAFYIDSLIHKYRNKSSKEISDVLTDMSFMEICSEVNELSAQGAELSDFIAHASVMAEKAEHINSDKLMEIINDPGNSENLRIIVLQILDYKGIELDDGNIKDLHRIVKEKKANNIILQNIIWILPESKGTDKLMESVALGDNDEMAFQALRRLNMDNPEQAVLIARKFIKDDIKGERKRIAIMVISQYLRKSDDEREKDDWVSYCDKELAKSIHADNFMLSNTIIYSLSGMRYLGAVACLINSDLLDETEKYLAAAENYKTFIDALSDNPTDEVIEYVIKAMEFCPTTEVIEKLKETVKICEKEYDLTHVLSLEAEPADRNYDLD